MRRRQSQQLTSTGLAYLPDNYDDRIPDYFSSTSASSRTPITEIEFRTQQHDDWQEGYGPVTDNGSMAGEEIRGQKFLINLTDDFANYQYKNISGRTQGDYSSATPAPILEPSYSESLDGTGTSIQYAPSKYTTRPKPKDKKPVAKIAKADDLTGIANVFGPVLQCFNPTMPGDAIPLTKSEAKWATYKALRKEEDALDKICSAVEQVGCHDALSIESRKRIQLRSVTPPMEEKGTPKKEQSTQTRGNHKRDMLDLVFEGVEEVACRDDMNAIVRRGMYADRDSLDELFEKVEGFTCPERIGAHVYQKGRRSPPELYRPHYSDLSENNISSQLYEARRGNEGQGKKSTHVHEDLLERFGNNFERAVCSGGTMMAVRDSDDDFLDKVFASVEEKASGQEGGYQRADQVHDAYNIDKNNSIIEHEERSAELYARYNELYAEYKAIDKPSQVIALPPRHLIPQEDEGSYNGEEAYQDNFSLRMSTPGIGRAKGDVKRLRAQRLHLQKSEPSDHRQYLHYDSASA